MSIDGLLLCLFHQEGGSVSERFLLIHKMSHTGCLWIVINADIWSLHYRYAAPLAFDVGT